jgi:hypothetical protein
VIQTFLTLNKDRPATKWQTLANEHMYDPAHVRSRTVQPMGGNLKPDLTLKISLILTILCTAYFVFLYFYDFSMSYSHNA